MIASWEEGLLWINPSWAQSVHWGGYTAATVTQCMAIILQQMITLKNGGTV